jgi:ATP-binding cassette, subfamily B (MDR/TAP), member 1
VEAIFLETFGAIRTVRSFTLEAYFHRKHSLAVRTAYNTSISSAVPVSLLFGAAEATVSMSTAVLMWYALRLSASYEFGAGQVFTALSLLMMGLNLANSMFSMIPQSSGASESARRLLRLAHLPLTPEAGGGRREMAAQAPMTDNKSIISLRQVGFSYPTRSSVRVLNGIDLDICQGSLIALVGPSGSGKSTIAALLMGLHSLPDHGEYSASSIRLYGQDIRNIPLSILRAICAFVPQHPTICPSTVWENICYGLDPHTCLTSASNVQWAAKMAAIDDFVESLPLRYDTIIGEGGLSISGGQAQRITLARALVRRPKVLILDEATSALDEETASLIRGNLRQAMMQRDVEGRGGDMTIIAITHARGMMQFADRVMMLEHGRKVEEGRFDELMIARGRFYAMLEHGEAV